MGSILVEAMALEVPTVAASVPAIVEVGGEPPAFRLFKVGDHNEMAGAVLDLLRDTDQRERAQLLGRARFLREYTAEAVSTQMQAFYKEAITESRFGERRSRA